MIARLLLGPRVRVAAPAAVAPRRTARSRAASARAALAFGLTAFGLATAGLVAAMETGRPQWRDPQYGYRLLRLREWEAKAPHRPLVVAFGSSRTQMGISPAAMGLPDEPGSPLVYNFGYRGAPLGVYALTAERVLDDGVRPRAVLIEVWPESLLRAQSLPGELVETRPTMFSASDVVRLGATPSVAARAAAAQAVPWTTHRLAVLSHWLPSWVPPSRRADLAAERLDDYGHTPNAIASVPAELRPQITAAVRGRIDKIMTRGSQIHPDTRVMLATLAARCRAGGAAVALVWMPAPVTVRERYAPYRPALEENLAALAREVGAAVFPDPGLPDDDFSDTSHLLPHAAAKYSRWLADTHLKPWLAGPEK